MTAAREAWLRAGGSLTERLSQLGARFDVQSIDQRVEPLLPGEARDLGLARGVRCLVREVVLRVDGVPLVWARSVTPRRGGAGPWRALAGLGTRPLAQLLFDDPRVRRSPLQVERHRRGGPWWRRADSAWREATGLEWPQPCVHARSSVFERRGARLRVFEAFVSDATRNRPPRLRTPQTRSSG